MVLVYIFLYNLLFFVFGLCVGSFLNVVIYRLPRRLSIVFPRSFCPKCRHKISFYDNIPLFSFAFLGGRCRHCHSPISFRYPLIEFLTGVMTWLAGSRFLYLGFGGIVELFLSLALVWGLIAVFFIDLENKVIPDEIVLPLSGLFLLWALVAGNWQALFSGAFSFLFLFLIWLLTGGRGMGFGDVKLAFLMGLCLGYPAIILAFYIAFLTGAAVGIILVLIKKARFGQQIAFGPFLVFGTIISLIWGEKIISLAQKVLF